MLRSRARYGRRGRGAGLRRFLWGVWERIAAKVVVAALVAMLGVGACEGSSGSLQVEWRVETQPSEQRVPADPQRAPDDAVEPGLGSTGHPALPIPPPAPP